MEIKEKYGRQKIFSYKQRRWPDGELKHAPRWCSVDLRDGNQALPVPMAAEAKLAFFELLCGLGFQEIEVGFPAASSIEADFVRLLAGKRCVPDDVTVQVLTQCRRNLVAQTMASISGFDRAIVHIYCSTSPLMRRVVFGMSEEEVLNIILTGVRDVMERSRDSDCRVSLEFSPEHFNQTEMDFSRRCCEAVAELWLPRKEGELIFNLPATVECTSPNVFADQVEWLSDHLSCRSDVCLSVHTHNDRGCAVAAAELALLAGADRVEGTVFGNGERTGNMDVICMAGNMLSVGIEPRLDLSGLPALSKEVERLTGMKVGPREPYAGELVFTAFSGSHQDAINKGRRAMPADGAWQIPYLLVDPADLGRRYEPVVRINSQSGKGGLDFILRSNYGLALPKGMLLDFAGQVQALSERFGEVLPEQIYNAFEKRYVLNQRHVMLAKCSAEEGVKATLLMDGQEYLLSLNEEMPGEELCRKLAALCGTAIGGANVREVGLDGPCGRSCFFASVTDGEGREYFGACIAGDAAAGRASALLSAVNNLLEGEKTE